MSFRTKAINEAFKRLKIEGVESVCTDTIDKLSERYIEKHFDDVVKNLVLDTLYWEGKLISK